jgi:Txe/YoeB family toxin of Txe-Axe toxin-antitoxin module
MRFKPSRRFRSKLRMQSTSFQNRAAKALKNLGLNPRSKGVNLEPVRGRKGYYTSRISRSHRLLLRQCEDENGDFWLVVDFGTHDKTY